MASGGQDFDTKQSSCCYLAIERYVNDRYELLALPAQATLSSVALQYGEESNRTQGLSRLSLRLVMPRPQRTCIENESYRTKKRTKNRLHLQEARREDAKTVLGFLGHRRRAQAWLEPNTTVTCPPDEDDEIRDISARFFIKNVHGERNGSLEEEYLRSYNYEQNSNHVLLLPNAVVFTNDGVTSERYQRSLRASAPEFVPHSTIPSLLSPHSKDLEKAAFSALDTARNSYLAAVVASGAAQAAVTVANMSYSNSAAEEERYMHTELPTWDDIENAISCAFAATTSISTD